MTSTVNTPLTIPEWVGSTLTHGVFLLYADKVLAVNHQRSFDETSTIMESEPTPAPEA